MPLYKYTAKDIAGKVKKGALNAASPDALKKALKDMGLYLSSFTEKVDKNRNKKQKKYRHFAERSQVCLAPEYHLSVR